MEITGVRMGIRPTGSAIMKLPGNIGYETSSVWGRKINLGCALGRKWGRKCIRSSTQAVITSPVEETIVGSFSFLFGDCLID